ncbi:MAG TPA: hypothetical protein VN836_10080 [Verrucomicrobiae bacterium]|nr:hypothetical protein [Verrucomicrobiae bacterium]
MIEPANPPDNAFKHFAPWLAALFLVVVGAQLWVVQLYGSPLPMWDQWFEAEWFYRPWVEGHLTWQYFFAPFNEHRILFTRLLDLGVIRLNGRWEPMLQMTVNAIIHAAFVCGLAGCLWDFTGRKKGWLVCFLLAPFFALPYAAENALWPMNSQQYFMSLCWLATLVGLGFGQTGSPRWWLGLASAVMGLFTMASGLLAPVSVGGLMILRALRLRRVEKGNLITLLCCLAVIGLGLALRVTSDFDRSLRAHTLMEFTAALTHNLIWPFFRAPAMVFLIPLPLAFLVALYFRPNFPEPRAAEFLLAMGLWSGLQSAALAYGRANYGDIIPASRYMDVLNIFVIASLFATVLLPRLWSGGRLPAWAGMLLPLVFAGVIFFGLCRISQIVVDNLLVPTRVMNLVAEERIETFWATGNGREFLEPPTVRPNPELALRLLQDPKLRPILPAACLPPASPPITGRFTAVSQWLLRHAVAILTAGLLLFAGLCGYGLARGAFGLARANPMGIVVLLAGLAALGFVWSKRSLQRESVEFEMQRELATYFKSVNDLNRAAFHEHRAEALQQQINSDGSRRP